MTNFLRALRLAWRYRTAYFLSLVFALAGAAVFSGSLGAVFPVMKVLFDKKTLQEWMAEKVADQERVVRELEGPADPKKLVDDPPPGAQNRRPKAAAAAELGRELPQLDLQRAKLRLAWFQRAEGLVARFVPRDRYQTLVLVVGLWMAGLVLKGVFTFCNETLVASVAERTMRDLRNRFYQHTVRMDLASFTDQGTSELLARFTKEMGAVAGGIETMLGKVVCEPFRAMACVALACWLNWRLTLLVVGLVPLAIFSVAILGRQLKRAARKSLGSMSAIYRILQETFQGIKLVKAFTMEAYERRRFYAETHDVYRRGMKIAMLEALATPVMEIAGVGAVVVALLAGAYLVINQTTHILGVRLAGAPMNPESLMLLYVFLAGVTDPVRKLSNVYGRIQRASAAADRLFAFLDRQPTIKSAPRAPRLARHHESVELDNVRFSYGGAEPVLTDINLKIALGETVAVVGPNGCGKTTLVNLLPRFYDPQAGTVRIDGVDVRRVALRSLRQQFGMVTQETLLFHDTILSNIAYGKRGATREEVEAASTKAHAHRFIEELPEGYETIVGERGMKLSGGERQRIALARAMLRDPAILILDEATSSLDVESESLVHRILKEFMRNRTTLLITHRLSSLQLADRIVVMNGGRIMDIGTHEGLVRRCPLYARLHEIHQAGQYLTAG